MFATIGRSFRLIKVCLHVLAVDKELVLFPVFSTIGMVLVLLTFLGVGIGIGALDRVGTGQYSILDIVVAWMFYSICYFVSIFFNSALVFAAHERLAGGDPNIRSGLRGASSCIGAIFVWALIAGTVGLILKILSNMARDATEGEDGGINIMGIIAQIIVALLGAAWTMATYFVVPCIVIEKLSLGAAFRSSLSMLRRTWGEQVTADFGLGLASLLAYILAGVITFILFLILSPLGIVGVIGAIVVGIALFFGIFLVFATVEGIYKAALYNYAFDGKVPSLFPEDVIVGAFHERAAGTR